HYRVGVELGARFAGRRVPDLHERAVSGRGNSLAVGAEGHAADLLAVLGEGEGFLALVPPERGRIPDADGPIGAGRGEALAVRADRPPRAPAGVPAQAEDPPAGPRVPTVPRLIFPARGETPAVRAEGDALDVSGVWEGVEEPAGRCLPHVHAPVEAGGGQPPV